MSRTSGEYPCPSPNQNIGQSCPIFFVSINHNGDIGAFTNVSYPFQQERGDLFGFLVNGGVEIRTINGIANGHNQWASPGIRSCQMRHSPSANEFLLLLGQSRASSQNGLTGSGLLGQFPNLLHACHQLFHRVHIRRELHIQDQLTRTRLTRLRDVPFDLLLSARELGALAVDRCL